MLLPSSSGIESNGNCATRSDLASARSERLRRGNFPKASWSFSSRPTDGRSAAATRGPPSVDRRTPARQPRPGDWREESRPPAPRWGRWVHDVYDTCHSQLPSERCNRRLEPCDDASRPGHRRLETGRLATDAEGGRPLIDLLGGLALRVRPSARPPDAYGPARRWQCSEDRRRT